MIPEFDTLPVPFLGVLLTMFGSSVNTSPPTIRALECSDIPVPTVLSYPHSLERITHLGEGAWKMVGLM